MHLRYTLYNIRTHTHTHTHTYIYIYIYIYIISQFNVAMLPHLLTARIVGVPDTMSPPQPHELATQLMSEVQI